MSQSSPRIPWPQDDIVNLSLLDSLLSGSHRTLSLLWNERPGGLRRRKRVDAERKRLEELPHEHREAEILAQIRLATRRAYATSVYYRELWKRVGFDPFHDFSFADFALLPTTSRKDILEAQLDPGLSRIGWRREATGGSTGEPLRYWLGPNERAWRSSASHAFLRHFCNRHETRIAYLWGHHLDRHRKATLRDNIADWMSRRLWLEAFSLDDKTIQSHLNQLEQFQPAVIVAYASAVEMLGRYCLERGKPPKIRGLKAIVTGAEKLYLNQQDIIEEAFRVPVYQRYGGRDIGDVAYQYDARGEFHVDWTLTMVEPQDLNVRSGILITKLRADGTPFIRYKNDDVAEFNADACPGRPTYIIKEVLGRTADTIRLPGGMRLSSIFFPHLMKDFPVRDFQIQQNKEGHVLVCIVPAESFTNNHRTALTELLFQNMPRVPIKIEEKESIPRGPANKWRPVISLAGDL